MALVKSDKCTLLFLNAVVNKSQLSQIWGTDFYVYKQLFVFFGSQFRKTPKLKNA